VYPCLGEDRWCAISVFTETQWESLKKAIGRPVWADSEKFGTLSARLKNSQALDDLIGKWTEQNTAAEVMTLLQNEGVPAGVVQNAAGLASDPQLKSRGFFVPPKHLGQGDAVADANPIRLARNPAEYRLPAPARGQDNDYVYRHLLGMTSDEVRDLHQKGVI
jgi:benzylsuccinate CoA-transferase BbsF subunit